MRKTAKKKNTRSTTYKNTARIQIGGQTIEVDIEQLARAIATNQADWPAYTGRAERVAQALPEILKCAVLTREEFL